MQKVAIIFQIIFAKKPKYTKKMFYQIDIIDIITANQVLQNAYITNISVYFSGLLFTFYEMNPFLEY